MTRKLLPYEYDLIDALGITKEEYLEFVALQQSYADSKQNTLLDVRADFGITAIILAVVGLIFNVVAALLTPRPRIPGVDQGGQRQTREERFSPRFGFNSAQELAKYGDPVALVYTDTSVNPAGGVRLAGSLLWSAVRSYGSNQFLQTLMLLSGGPIVAINYAKSAFGQTAVSSLVAQNNWLYFNPGGTGVLAWANELNGNADGDPTKYGSALDNPYRIQPLEENIRIDGFSQAYSPSSAASCGVFSPVPIHLNLYLRNEAGDKQAVDLGIYAATQGWDSGPLQRIEVGYTMQILILATNNVPNDGSFDSDLQREAAETRRTLSSVFDDSGVFKLGSAVYKAIKIFGASTDNGYMYADLVCVSAGHSPSVNYAVKDPAQSANDIESRTSISAYRNVVNNLLNEDARDNMAENPYIDSLPENQRLSIVDAQSLLQSRQIYILEPYESYDDTSYRYAWSRDITQDELNACSEYINLSNAVRITSDSTYYSKVIGRYEEATYSTVSACNVVDIALKASVYRRISGRQERYGSQNRVGYPASDNGICHRTSLFMLRYRNSESTPWSNAPVAPGLFAIRRAADNDNFVFIKFYGGPVLSHWQFKLQPVIDPAAEARTNPGITNSEGRINYFYLQNSGNPTSIPLSSNTSFYFVGYAGTSTNNIYPFPPINQSPDGTNEWDWFSLDADTQLQTSFERGPEIQITAVSEQIQEAFTSTLYNNLSLIGFNVFSGRNLQDMRSFTAFVTQGRPVRKLRTAGYDPEGNPWGSDNYAYYPTVPDGPTCFAPDIFLDTVIDSQDGIGNYAEVAGIDLKQLAITKRFCQANNLFMDAVIADRQNWREFWVTNATSSLLEFSRTGGRESLVPAVPYNPDTGAFTRQIAVTALFNQGNILEDSYKEENLDYGSNVQDLIVSVTYRSLDADGTFAINRSVEIQRSDTVEIDAIRQSFDLSSSVTTEAQAILYGKLLCNTRRYVRTAIEFKTFPTTSPVAPGAYIYVDIGQNNWDGVKTGVIGPGGFLNKPIDNTVLNGNYQFLLYRSGDGVISTTATVSDNFASTLSTREGWLFVLGTQVTSRRVFRVNEVQMDEEGEITVRATIYPCDQSGQSLIADFSDSLFTVRR